VILTGMGDDGADGMVRLRQAGGWVVGQDEASSVVYGMPREAFLRGGVHQQVALADVAGVIASALEKQRA
jgi:two-component system chemotaxis response regulator CheB